MSGDKNGACPPSENLFPESAHWLLTYGFLSTVTSVWLYRRLRMAESSNEELSERLEKAEISIEEKSKSLEMAEHSNEKMSMRDYKNMYRSQSDQFRGRPKALEELEYWKKQKQDHEYTIL